MSLAPRLRGTDRPTVSFELYPPRSAAGVDAVHRTVAELSAVLPDFFSVTYGASGATRGPSADLVRHVLASTPVPVLAHLTCVGASRREVVELATAFFDAGVRDVLALRGDPPAGQEDWRPHPDGVHRACDLVELLQVADRRHLAQRGGARPVDEQPLSIAVAAFPSGGPDDLAALRAKQDAGAHFAVAQVCYRASEYADHLARARAAGITIPVLPGVVPTTDPARLLRLQQLTGVPVPRELLAVLETAQESGDTARRRAGTAWGARLVRELLDAGAPGVHVYTFNSHDHALDLLEGAHLDTRTPTVPPAAGRPQAGSSPEAPLPEPAAQPAGGTA
ncbi:methylenetetrahydrofolate reductase [Kineococcus terrestris]|uniref:methylenetetrahydrofolate reductase n=1 Tax=Kineococcus terrestris TaxID=2044856 RepID=UPI0034DB740D